MGNALLSCRPRALRSLPLLLALLCLGAGPDVPEAVPAPAVAHYHGDLSAPARLGLLEAQVSEALGVARWLGP